MDNKENAVVYNTPPENYYQKPVREPFNIEGRDKVFAVFAVISSVILTVCGLFSGLAVGFSVAAVIMLLLFAFYLAGKTKPSAITVLCGILCVLNCIPFVTTTTGSVRFFSFCAVILLGMIFLHGITANKTAKGDVGFFAGIIKSSFSTVANVGVSVKSLFFASGDGRKAFLKSLIGIACAIPMLFVIVPLLISSDEAFTGLMLQLFADTFEIIIKAIVGVALSFLVVSYGLSLKNQRLSQVKEIKFKGMDNAYIISFLSVIAVCYLLYLFSQFAYFFSAFSGFLPDGYQFTASQYARRGFFEMTVIAVINFILIYLALCLSSKRNGKTNVAIKILSTFIAIFTMIIIVTAISKMVLYIGSFGMTVLRITTSAFMVFLFIVFISVILKTYIPRVKVLKTALLTAGCILLMLGVVNVDAVVAKYNYDSYVNGRLEGIDVQAIYFLGDEGVPYLAKLTKDNDYVVARQAKRYLHSCYRYDYFDGPDNFTVKELREKDKRSGLDGFNIPNAIAYDVLYDYIEENPKFRFYEPIY